MVNPKQQSLAPGLYLVATPIGTARDITLRTLDILGAADVIAAEDTRSLRKLMGIHGISPGDRPVLAYHDHNGEKMRPRLLAALAEGKSVVYASEAGTPMVADPGYDLARAAVAEGHALISAPGPSAVIAALTVAGAMAFAWAYARAEAQVLVPLEYSGFLWASLFGWLFFAEQLTLPTVVGTAIIIASCWLATRRPRAAAMPQLP